MYVNLINTIKPFHFKDKQCGRLSVLKAFRCHFISDISTDSLSEFHEVN